MKLISFKRHRFTPDIIRHAVWLYAKFRLLFRDVEDMLSERGIIVSKEIVRRWLFKFGGQSPATCVAPGLGRTTADTLIKWQQRRSPRFLG
jgi:transposase-like protein